MSRPASATDDFFEHLARRPMPALVTRPAGPVGTAQGPPRARPASRPRPERRSSSRRLVPIAAAAVGLAASLTVALIAGAPRETHPAARTVEPSHSRQLATEPRSPRTRPEPRAPTGRLRAARRRVTARRRAQAHGRRTERGKRRRATSRGSESSGTPVVAATPEPAATAAPPLPTVTPAPPPPAPISPADSQPACVEFPPC